jgi:dTDP-4-dehydrorhamnose 3,5-epimerase
VRFLPTTIPDVVLVEPDVLRDTRGYFFEVYHSAKFAAGGIDAAFVQDNQSRSPQGTLRGLHAQLRQPQGKLLRVLEGAILDVAVDVRLGSPTFGAHIALELSAENRHMLWVPPGFVHGFCVTSEHAQVEYKCTQLYDPTDEYAIVWNDPELAIPWPTTTPQLSAKDSAAPTLRTLRDQGRLPTYAG